ncbi:MAG: Similar to citrate lyase beta chain, 2, partial [uncultured Thermomicrobiales bacterium]
ERIGGNRAPVAQRPHLPGDGRPQGCQGGRLRRRSGHPRPGRRRRRRGQGGRPGERCRRLPRPRLGQETARLAGQRGRYPLVLPRPDRGRRGRARPRRSGGRAEGSRRGPDRLRRPPAGWAGNGDGAGPPDRDRGPDRVGGRARQLPCHPQRQSPGRGARLRPRRLRRLGRDAARRDRHPGPLGRGLPGPPLGLRHARDPGRSPRRRSPRRRRPLRRVPRPGRSAALLRDRAGPRLRRQVVHPPRPGRGRQRRLFADAGGGRARPGDAGGLPAGDRGGARRPRPGRGDGRRRQPPHGRGDAGQGRTIDRDREPRRPRGDLHL